MKWWLTAYILAQALDMSTTAYRLHRGCREAVWPNATTMYAGKSAGIVVTLTIKDTHPTAAKIVAGIGIVSGTYGAIHNLRQSCL